MCSHQTELTVAKHLVGFVSIIMNGCIFIWIGSKNRLDTLCFAQNFRGMNLIESPKPNYLTDSFATKLNKLFPSKQQFFQSTKGRSQEAELEMEFITKKGEYLKDGSIE
ncbi:hypothetical protein WUBG_10905 [Wuchereria bancrofti]|uniref:Uncharacterized protein n=1 Tax=Wuchereria bancrofti TaxID=6293 RepID=J9ESF2_WUCBA|nr:hypothetical protein WUBG_10905 [Wuchereria bancrofti]